MNRSTATAIRVACAASALTSGCSSYREPSVLQEIDLRLGAQRVHVTYDAGSRVCSSLAGAPAVCQTVERTPTSGVSAARLDPAPGAGYVLRMLTSPGVVFDDLPGDASRAGVAMNTDLVVASFDSAPACFHQTNPDGQTRTVTVAASQVDTGTGITAAVSTETAC